MFSFAVISEGQFILMVLAIIVLPCVIAAIMLSRLPGPKQALQKWAEKQGVEIQNAEKRLFRRGPFSYWLFRSTKGQTVCRITVKDASGHIRSGYVRIGGFFGLGDYVKVAWDRDPESDVDVPDVDDVL